MLPHDGFYHILIVSENKPIRSYCAGIMVPCPLLKLSFETMLFVARHAALVFTTVINFCKYVADLDSLGMYCIETT